MGFQPTGEHGPPALRGASLRRDALAEAAVAILGRDGGRGLTHRAVDRELRLPIGTTSAYLRKRSDLLLAAYQKVIARDRQRLDDQIDRLAATASGSLDLARAARFVGDLTRAVIRTDDNEGRARFECLLAASRDPAVAAMLNEDFRSRHRYWIDLFTRLEAPDPERASRMFEMLFRGIVYSNTLLASLADATLPTPAAISGLLSVCMSA